MDIQTRRLRTLRATIRESNLDAIALIPGANYHYYTGIHAFVDLLTTILVIPAEGSSWADHPIFLLPGFERNTTESLVPFKADYIPYERHLKGYAEGFKQLAARITVPEATLGVESTAFRYLEIAQMKNADPSIKLSSADDLLMGFRCIKSPDEIECIRKAAQLTEVALEAIAPQVVPGKTERELSARFQIELLKAGADGKGFDCLVVSGPRAALQHAAPSDRQIQQGDTVLFDVGGTYQGYTADITRTFVVGQASEKIRSIYGVVREANQAAFDAVRPGILASDVDAAARSVIAEAGYGETFIHGTGHGLGLEVHEPPRIAAGSDVILQPGMVFTIEPGIYISGELGVRIEDDVVVTQDGVERLTGFDYELRITP